MTRKQATPEVAEHPEGQKDFDTGSISQSDYRALLDKLEADYNAMRRAVTRLYVASRGARP